MRYIAAEDIARAKEMDLLLKFRRTNGENPDKIGVFFGYIFFVASLWHAVRDSNPRPSGP